MSQSTQSINLKTGLAEMLKGGVIMDVMNVEQAKIAEQAGAVAVMALERIPSLIRSQGGVARMSDPLMIQEIMKVSSIPVMAKVRIGHFAEAQILQELGVDFIDESEVLTPADEENHIDKHAFKVPFVCGCTDLGEALRRIGEGAALIRTKGEAGTGNVVEAVRHMRTLMREIRKLTTMDASELYAEAKRLRSPLEIVQLVAKTGKLPVPNFSAGGVATPADAALMLQLGAETVFVGSGIFADATSAESERRAKAIVAAVAQPNNAAALLEASRGLPRAMTGVEMKAIPEEQRLAQRGW
ncbi:MAG: pyridoxal 5'-phosphate synthase lyase subunit PdxS [Bacteriovoracia bacterium]